MTGHETHNPSEVVDQLREMEFRKITNFNSAHIGVFWSEAGGPGPWEMHPDSEELLHVLEGEVEIEVLPEEGEGIKTRISSGSFMVVPQGRWHRHSMITKSKELFLSPERTEHSSEIDPR